MSATRRGSLFPRCPRQSLRPLTNIYPVSGAGEILWTLWEPGTLTHRSWQVEELVRSDDIDAVISLGIVGRIEYLRLMDRSLRRIDETTGPGFLDEAERFLLEYEEKYIARTAELMERFKKPVIGVTIAKTSGGVVRRLPAGVTALSSTKTLKAPCTSLPRWRNISASWQNRMESRNEGRME